MNDRVLVRGLRVGAHVGVGDEERSRSQILLITVEARRSLRRAAQSDDVKDTIDYGVLVRDLTELVGGIEAKLLERVADLVADHVLALPEVTGVVVEIAKESPPLEQSLDLVAVRIERP